MQLIVAVSATLLIGASAAQAIALRTAARQTYRLTFVLDPAVVGELTRTEVGRRLNAYVTDLNGAFRRQTPRDFAFTSSTGLIIGIPSATLPCSDTDPGRGSTFAAEIVICVKPSTTGTSGNGSAARAGTSREVRGRIQMNWTKVHNPDTVSRDVAPAGAPESPLQDYARRQMNTLMHELEHVFNAGTGEYYGLYRDDTTGTAPNTPLTGLEDSLFGWDHRNYSNDPLSGAGPGNAVREELAAAVRLLPENTAVINTDWSYPTEPWDTLESVLSNSSVAIVDRFGAPLPGANVEIWRVPNNRLLAPTKISSGVADSEGRMGFSWGCAPCDRATNNAILIKASTADLPTTAVWRSVFDEFGSWTGGSSATPIRVQLFPPDTTPPVLRINPTPTSITQYDEILIRAYGDDSGVRKGLEMWENGTRFCRLPPSGGPCAWRPVKPGNKYISVYAFDARGNVSTSTVHIEVTEHPDQVQPTITPVGVPTRVDLGATVDLSYSTTASEDWTQYSSVEVQGTRLCTGSNVPAPCSWTPTKPGRYSVLFTASDRLRRKVMATRSILVADPADVATPRFEGLDVVGTKTVGNAVRLRVRVRDDVALRGVRVRLSAPGLPDVGEAFTPTSAAGEFTTRPFDLRVAGAYAVEVTAIDSGEKAAILRATLDVTS